MVRMTRTMRTISTFLLLTLCSSYSHAFPLAKILFHGNAHIASGQLLDAIGENILKRSVANRSELFLAVEQAKQSIQKHYSSNGFLYARIDSFQTSLAVPNDSSQGFQLDFFIFEGLPYRISSISIRGNTILTEHELTSKMASAPGQILNETTLQNDISRLLALYEQYGYPLAKISIEAIT